MAETRIMCPEWTTVEEADTNSAARNSRSSNSNSKCSYTKHNTSRCVLRARNGAGRLVRFFFFLGTIGLTSFVVLRSYDEFKDSINDDSGDSSSSGRHRDKRQSGTCHVDMCLTQECVHAASSILNSMDDSVDPCEDFFQYTCGNWIHENKHKIGMDELFFSINHNSLPEKIDRVLSDLLKQEMPIPEEFLETLPYQNLFTFFESCLLVGQMGEDVDVTEALELLKNLEEFSIGRPFDPSSWNLTKALVELMRINGAPLIDVTIQSDVRKPGRFGINITPPRRYGLLPGLLQPRMRNPGIEENLRLKSRRRAILGDLSDDLLMIELLSALEEGRRSPSSSPPVKKRAAHLEDSEEGVGEYVGMGEFEARGSSHLEKRSGDFEGSSVVGKPSVNILPTDDYLEKKTSTTTSPPKPPVASSSSSFPSSSPPPEEMPPGVTQLGPIVDSTDLPFYVEEDPDYQENATKIVSRKSVFKLFMNKINKKRTEAIGTMVQNSFTNISEEVWASSFGKYQPEDVFSAVIDNFVPLLDEIQPTHFEELKAQQHGLLYNHFTLDQLQEFVPTIEWKYLLSELFFKNITEEDNIYVYQPFYLLQLHYLLSDLDPWVVHYGLVALYAYDILREATTAPAEMDREDFCLQATKNVFGDVMSHMYIHHVGNKTINDIRKHTSTIIENVRDEVRQTVKQSEGMTESDKREALIKVDGLQAELAALDKHWDINYVNESHTGILLSANESFLHNVMQLYRAFRTELYRVYHEPVDRDMLIWSFAVQPFTVNAFYMLTTNTIVFPEAFFHKPYYSPKAPEYINYGSAGSSIAHEIFHGLDFTGTMFDHRGIMNGPFSNSTRMNLRETIDCYHRLLSDNFYEEVPVEETLIAMEIDSTTTLNENLADIGGITHAFRAYQRWEAEHYREPRLPAISLSPYQLFFVAAVRPYCAVIPNLAKIFLMEMDEHLPNGMRMNAVLMNTPEFAEVFNCKPGSRMVANQTCPIFR